MTGAKDTKRIRESWKSHRENPNILCKDEDNNPSILVRTVYCLMSCSVLKIYIRCSKRMEIGCYLATKMSRNQQTRD